MSTVSSRRVTVGRIDPLRRQKQDGAGSIGAILLVDITVDKQLVGFR